MFPHIVFRVECRFTNQAGRCWFYGIYVYDSCLLTFLIPCAFSATSGGSVKLGPLTLTFIRTHWFGLAACFFLQLWEECHLQPWLTCTSRPSLALKALKLTPVEVGVTGERHVWAVMLIGTVQTQTSTRTTVFLVRSGHTALFVPSSQSHQDGSHLRQTLSHLFKFKPHAAGGRAIAWRWHLRKMTVL